MLKQASDQVIFRSLMELPIGWNAEVEVLSQVTQPFSIALLR